MAKFVTIDASAAEAGVDYAGYLANYFTTMATTTRGATTYYGSTFFAPYGYYDGSQVGVRYAASTNNAQVVMEGADLQYDGIVGVDGSYSGSVDAVTFGYWDDATTFAQIDGVARSTLIGVLQELKISGLDIVEAVGAGAGADNEFYALMNALRDGNSTTIAEGNTETTGALAIQALYDLFSAKRQSFVGSDGDDTYVGTKFADRIDGGAGVDSLSGGKGKDVFIFDLGDSGNTVETADTILDFNRKQDRIDLRLIDANTAKDGDQAFKFIGEGDFSGKAGQVNFEKVDGQTHVSLDIDGDKVADMIIVLEGSKNLTADNFLL